MGSANALEGGDFPLLDSLKITHSEQVESPGMFFEKQVGAVVVSHPSTRRSKGPYTVPFWKAYE